MSAHVLLNLLNKIGKSDKLQGLQSILSFFCIEFGIFNNSVNVRFLLLYVIKITLKPNFLLKMLRFCKG